MAILILYVFLFLSYQPVRHRRQLPPAADHRRLLQGCLAAVAAVLRRRLPPAK